MSPDTSSGELLNTLEGELERLDSLFPGLRFRFCRVMGRRVSHLTGDTSIAGDGELKLPVTPELLLFVRGPWSSWRRELEEYTDGIARRIAGLQKDSD